MLRSCTPGVRPEGVLQACFKGGGRASGALTADPQRSRPWFPQPDPLILRPGPIYAVDGDRGIDQRIVYSLLTGE